MTNVALTGASGRLGQSLVPALIDAGHRVIAFTRSKKGLENLLNKNSDAFSDRRLSGCAIDLTARDAIDRAADYCASSKHVVEALIHNARSLDHLKAANDTNTERDMFLSELLLDIVVPHQLTMRLCNPDHSLRRVIIISSIYGIVAPNRRLYEQPEELPPVHYGVAKAGQIHLAKELAVRLAERDITVNTISYGGVDGRADAAFMARYAHICPSGRMLSDRDVVGPALFFLSEQSEAITGHNLVVDGGWTTW